MRELKVFNITLYTVLRATGLVHHWFVAVLARSSPPPVDQVLVVSARQFVRPHAL